MIYTAIGWGMLFIYHIIIYINSKTFFLKALFVTNQCYLRYFSVAPAIIVGITAGIAPVAYTGATA